MDRVDFYRGPQEMFVYICFDLQSINFVGKWKLYWPLNTLHSGTKISFRGLLRARQLFFWLIGLFTLPLGCYIIYEHAKQHISLCALCPSLLRCNLFRCNFMFLSQQNRDKLKKFLQIRNKILKKCFISKSFVFINSYESPQNYI